MSFELKKKKAPHMSTKDYTPQLLEVWRDAGLRPIHLPMPTLGAAVTFRHKMYRLRMDMRREKHAYADSAAKAKISIAVHLKNGTTISFSHRKNFTDADIARIELILSPSDGAEVDEALAAAGYGVPEAPIFK